MGYYTKHIFRIAGKHTTDDLVELANAIYKATGYDYCVYPDIDCIDDRRWNCWDGSKLYDLYDGMKKTSLLFPAKFTVDCRGEEGEEYTLTCKNGEVLEEVHTEWDDENERYKKVDSYPHIDYDISRGEWPEKVIEIDTK